MFWIGMLSGVFVGGAIALFGFSACFIAKRADECENCRSKHSNTTGDCK